MPDMRLLHVLVLPLFVVAGLVQAAEKIEEVVITPNRIPVPLRQIATSVAVITRVDIADHGNTSLADVLRQLPGVATSSNGGIGQPSGLRIRGEEGFRTLTILDGMRLSDPGGPQIGPQIEHLLSSGIDRVEVLRGPQGLGYGADAGGVLNIIAARADKGLLGGIDAQTGRFDTRQVSGHASGGNASTDFFVTAADFSTGGFNNRTSDNVLPDRDGYSNTTVHARAGINLNEQWRAEFIQRRVEGEAEFDDCGFGVAVHDCLSVYDLQASRAALSYKAEAFTHSLGYASTSTDRDSLLNGRSTFATAGELERWEYVGSAQNLPGFVLVIGADHERAAMDTRERNNVGFFGEILSDFSDSWYFTAGARHDDNDDFGSNTSYRISSVRLIDVANAGTLKFKASMGTGFRAPSPYEIAYNTGPWASAPASLVSLQQERSKGYEAGAEWLAINGLRLEAVYFDQRVDDAIIFDLNGYSGYLQDAGRSTSRGIELSTEVQLSATLSLQANYTWNDTNRPDGTQRLRRPENLANAGLRWQLQPKLALNAFVRASHNAVDQDFSGVVVLDDFSVLDLNASYSVSDSLQLYGRLENALAERYEEVTGYNTSGTAAFVGFRMNLGVR